MIINNRKICRSTSSSSSSSTAAAPQPFRALASSRIFSTNFFLQGEVSEASVFISPETRWPSYTPGHRVARGPRDRHSPYPLTWAPEGDVVIKTNFIGKSNKASYKNKNHYLYLLN
jgi:hypothetical protein